MTDFSSSNSISFIFTEGVRKFKIRCEITFDVELFVFEVLAHLVHFQIDLGDLGATFSTQDSEAMLVLFVDRCNLVLDFAELNFVGF